MGAAAVSIRSTRTPVRDPFAVECHYPFADKLPGLLLMPKHAPPLLARKARSWRQHLIIEALIDQSTSKSRRPGSAAKTQTPEIKNEFLAEYANCSVRHVSEELRDLVERGLIRRWDHTGKLDEATDEEDCGGRRAYRYEVLIDEWAKLPDYCEWLATQRVDKKEKDVGQTGTVVPVAGEPFVLMPGAKSKPTPLSQAIREHVQVNESKAEVKLDYREDDGILYTIIRDVIGGKAARQTGTRVPVNGKSHAKNKRVTISELRAAFTATWRDRFPKQPLEDSLLERAIAALGDQPLEQLMSRVASEFPKMAKAHRLQTGSIVALAKQCNTPDAAREWDAIAVESRAIDERAVREHQLEAKQRERLIEENRAILDDPTASKEDKRWAKELLESLS